MSIILYALIGAAINAGAAYWIFYGLHCAVCVLGLIVKLLKDD